MGISAFKLTDAGAALLVQAALSGDITFTRGAVGKGYLAAASSETAQTALIDSVCNMSVSSATVSTGAINVKLQFTNASGDGFLAGFNLAEIGLFGKIGTGTETLIAYANARDAAHADFIPGDSLREFTFTFNLRFTGAENVNVTVGSSIVYANAVHTHAATDITGLNTAISGKADKPATTTAGHFAALDANGNLTDSGKSADSFVPALVSISVTTPPTKTAYYQYEAFDATGMVVTATWGDGTTKIIADYTTTPAIMAADTTTVLISYTFGVTTKTCAQAVTVAAVSSTLANNSWDTIATVSARGKASDHWAVGGEKTITLNGTTYTAQIIGFNHDNLATSDAKYNDSNYNNDTKKAGITFALKECFATTYPMNSSDTNAGGWNDCAMRTSTLGVTMLGYLPTDVKNALRTVNKLTSMGNQIANITTSTDELFLFSEIEIFGTAQYSKSGEGSQYAYWAAGNSRIKNRNGSTDWWQERSPTANNSTGFCRVNASGGSAAGSTGASTGGSVSFGFCI